MCWAEEEPGKATYQRTTYEFSGSQGQLLTWFRTLRTVWS